ncbi:unnamed protein product [Heligmosomoides polygyrus]|uniref:MULE domain-containing protein n=1 Tax=Heligmosomoides polygyrus TaxID=6339 RepID=A0A3P8A5Y8_HELPZ|nr:unnamed protein product [Heligmosomoides polygyrus]
MTEINSEGSCTPADNRKVCRDPKERPHAFKAPFVEVAEVLSRIASERFEEFTDPERRAMVEQVVQPNLNGRDNTRRTLCRAQTMTRRQADQGFIPVQLNPAACRCVADGESFILLDEAERIYFGSRSLIAAAFHSMTLRNDICDGRYKRIPAAFRRGASSQFYSVIGIFNEGTALPLVYTFISGGTETTYRHLFAFLWQIIVGLGVQRSLTGCTFLFDFEVPAINAVTREMPIVAKGCFFHYTQAMVRHRDILHFRPASLPGYAETANQLVIAKGMVGPAADGARPHYVRRDDEMRQLERLSRFVAGSALLVS